MGSVVPSPASSLPIIGMQDGRSYSCGTAASPDKIAATLVELLTERHAAGSALWVTVTFADELVPARELLAPLGSTWTSSIEFSPDFQHLALIRDNALELVPTALPAARRRISLGDTPNPYQLIGWGEDGRYYAAANGALLAWTPDGVEVFRHAMPDPEASVRLSPGGGFALFMGRALDIVRLRDHRSARLGVADAEALRALFDEAP